MFHRAASSLALLAAFAVSPAIAQVPTDQTIVLTQLAGSPRAQLLAITSTGAIATFGRFASDTATPQAIALDPVDRQPIVAIDLGGGASRVLRLVPGAGLTFAFELVLADLPGQCAQIEVVGDDIVAIVGGAGGGVFKLPRRGGAVAPVVALPNACAAHVFPFSNFAMVAWSGATVPPSAPGLAFVDLATGTITSSPFPFNNRIGAEPTGLFDLPTALSRQVVAFTDGTFWLHTVGLGDPTPIAMVPQPPAGGAAAVHQDLYSFSALAIGGASMPALYRVDSAGTITVQAQPLPGAPIDFAVAASPFPQIVPFGNGCGAPPLQLVNGVRGPPQIGNSSFEVRALGTVPGQPTAFVWGFDDVLGGALPLPVLGCPLHVSPDIVDLVFANAGGLAIKPLPVPANPALAGAIAFGQWAQLLPAGTVTSPAFAMQVGL